MAVVDAVVVAYSSRAHLRLCVEPLAREPDVHVVVVDNASPEDDLEAVADLPLTGIRRASNGGFAAGCNDGWRAGQAPYVLFLNPDATLDRDSLGTLVAALDADPTLAAAAPRIEHPDGSLAWSQRRFPRISGIYARALFLHRLFPRAAWADDIVRDPAAYARVGEPDWLSGACLLVRRSALEQIGGWDDGFFFYGEDVDLCRRLRQQGHGLRFEPSATAVHAEGGSAPRSSTLPLLAASRIRYARKHRGSAGAAATRAGVALGSLTHAVVSRGGKAVRAGHLRALRVALGGGVPGVSS